MSTTTPYHLLLIEGQSRTAPKHIVSPSKKLQYIFWQKILKYIILGSPCTSINGSTRTRLQPIRTASEIQIKIVIESIQRTPLYQKLAQKIEELLLLGMSFRAIARSLGVNRRTIIRAYEYINRPTQEEK